MAEKKNSILVNPEGKSWDFAKKVFDYVSQKSQEFELNTLEVKKFADGEIKPKILNNIRGRTCFFIHDSNEEPARWFLELTLVNQALKKSSAGEIINVLPYLRFARQDRKDEPRVPINAKVIADTIDLYADAVLTIDIHNPAIEGFFDIRFDNLYSFAITINYLQEKHPEILQNLVIMSPDVGGAPRAQAFAKKLGIKEVVFGYKTRKTAGDVENLRIAGDVEGKNVLLIDDIIDSGGTAIKAAQEAKKNGALSVYGYCTHGLFTKGVDYVMPYFDKFFVGNTLQQEPHEKLEVIDFSQLFGEAIFRISENMSLSELFK
ncbi:MAG: ribose-phosphate diphosphokinase [Nanoarchaeota archaeon]